MKFRQFDDSVMWRFGQMTFGDFYFLITYGVCKKRKYCNRMSEQKKILFFFVSLKQRFGKIAVRQNEDSTKWRFGKMMWLHEKLKCATSLEYINAKHYNVYRFSTQFVCRNAKISNLFWQDCFHDCLDNTAKRNQKRDREKGKVRFSRRVERLRVWMQ